MAILIGHASIGEQGARNNVSGDQTGKEVCTRGWYNGNWHTVLRCKDSEKAEQMAQACEAACLNSNIGYDQNQRNTLRKAAKAANFDLSKVGKCECDCSSLMAVCAECAAVEVPYVYENAPTTSSMVSAFKSTGEFAVLTESKYLTSDKYLRRGDILVKSGHTVMVLEDGSDAKETEIGTVMYSHAFDKEYKTTAELNLRIGAGTSHEKVTVMKKNASVRCYGYFATSSGGTKWLMVQYGKCMGFCSSKYLK
jgi:hypothetical protein